MSKPSICCVVPTIRQSHMEEFRKAWARLFEKHNVTLITVWDGDVPDIEHPGLNNLGTTKRNLNTEDDSVKSLLCRKTDAVRNWGFIEAAKTGFDCILTLDDDVHPPAGSDPIQEHLDVLQRRVPISWMNTAMENTSQFMWNGQKAPVGMISDRGPIAPEGPIYLRGFPYSIRDEAPVMVSHGVWVNVPDFDGRTQLELTNNGRNPERLPYSLPYFRGPVPKGCYFPFCGMNVMVRKEALPYLYFAPMGPDALPCEGCDGGKIAPGPHADGSCCPYCKGKFSELNRFADIWCGILLKRACDSNGWAIYTGASTVIHTRASDPFKNVEQEKLGIEWNEKVWDQLEPSYTHTIPDETPMVNYWKSYLNKAARFRGLIRKLQGTSKQ